MPDVSYFDQSKIGQYRENESYLCKLAGVDPGGTPSIVDSVWYRLPDEGESSYQKEGNEFIVENVKGLISAKKTSLKSVPYESTLNQRDAVTMLLDETFKDFDCALLVKSHNFTELGKQQWILIFGSPVLSTDAVNLAEGKVKFKFQGRANAVALVFGSGGLAYLASVSGTPTTMTIAANGVWSVVDA